MITLEIESRERAFQNGTGMHDLHRFFHGDVAPMRNLKQASHLGHRQEWRVVLEMNPDIFLKTICFFPQRRNSKDGKGRLLTRLLASAFSYGP